MKYFQFAVLLFAATLISCHSKQQTFRKQLPESLCSDLKTLRSMIETDRSVSNEFNFSSPDSIVFYSETCVHAGFQPFLFFRKIEDLVAANKGMTKEEAYLKLEKSGEKHIKVQVALPKDCLKNSTSIDSADLMIEYWYNPADSNYSVGIEKILHQPGYAHGFVIEYARTDSGFVQIQTSNWVE